jgi:hypothetical protein
LKVWYSWKEEVLVKQMITFPDRIILQISVPSERDIMGHEVGERYKIKFCFIQMCSRRSLFKMCVLLVY